MKPLQKIGAAAMAGALALVLGACGAQPASAPEAEANSGSYKIGVIQLTEHPALDAANEGFIAALDDSGIDYTVDQQNAQGDQSACQTIASKLVNDDDDLILAIATPPVVSLWWDTLVPPVTLVGHLCCHTAATPERRARQGRPAPGPFCPGPCMPEPAPAWVLLPRGAGTHAGGPTGMGLSAPGTSGPCRRPLRHGRGSSTVQ